MILTKKQISTILLLLGLIVGIFLTIYLVKQRQEIRPRALQGKANLLLSAGNTSPKVGDSFDVLVSLQLTDASLQVSGADVMILYDKTRLQVTNLLPQVPNVDPNAAFTDAPIVTYNGDYPVGTDNPDDTFNFARVSLVARKTTANLAKGTVSLAHITFKTLNIGTATIKFPDDNNLLQIVGYGLGIPTAIPPTATGIPPSATPINSPTPTITPGGPTLTPSPTPTEAVAPVTSTPTPTPNGGVNVRGLIFVENVQNGIKGPNEVVLTGVPLTIDGHKKDGTSVHFTVTSDAGNDTLTKNYTFYGITAGTYKIIQPQVAGKVVEKCPEIAIPTSTSIPVGDLFYCLGDGNYRLKQWISNDFVQFGTANNNEFEVKNNPVSIDFPMRPAQ